MDEALLEKRLWSRMSFVARLSLGAALVLAAAAAILLVTVTVRDALTFSGDLDRQLQMEIAAALPTIADAAVGGDEAVIRLALAARLDQPNVRHISWQGRDGTTAEVAAVMPPVLAPAWFASGVGVSEPIAARPLVVAGTEIGTLTMTMSTISGINRLWSVFLSHLNLLALAVGLEFLGIVIILRSGLRPLQALITGAQRLGGGDLTTQIEPSGGPEMRQTIEAFNGMATNLTTTLRELRRSHEELRIAATAFETEEGMIVADAQQVILRVNRAFSTITGYEPDEVLGKSPQLLQASELDEQFYQQIWRTVEQDRYWQGEVWHRHKLGQLYPAWQSISAVVAPDGRLTHYIIALSDISQRKAAEEQIRNLAYFDPLTQLPNRRLLLERLSHAVSTTGRQHQVAALLCMDLDEFKLFNDTAGHEAGDDVLIETARRLRVCAGEGNTVARTGGDEFVVLLEGLGPDEATVRGTVEAMAARMLEAAAKPYQTGWREYQGTASVGIVVFDERHHEVEELLKRAAVALYQTRLKGRSSFAFFDPAMQQSLAERAIMENELRRVISQDQLELYYQPQLDDGGSIIGAEALLRWHHPERGLVSPADFIPLAEETGLIIPIGNWVLEQACLRLKEWEADERLSRLILAVNVSIKQFQQPDFVETVRRIVDASSADPHHLKLELTESVIVDDIADTVEKMKALKAFGVGFSMDDFGTGYSSLSFLRRLPLDQLKIDRSFIHEVESNTGDAVIVKTILAMAQALGLDVIAEGVEKEAQHRFLNRHACRAYQGFLFGKPMPVKLFEAMLQRRPGANN